MAEARHSHERLIPPDLWVLLGLGLLGIVFFFAKYDDSFPAASIDLKVSRIQAARLARQWADRVGFDDRQAIQSTVFNIDDDAKTFLEYELGQAKANALMKNTIPVWTWSSRFCRPYQIEDLDVGIGPDGSLHYLSLAIPNDQPGRSIPHAQALALARRFIEGDARVSLANARLIKDSQESELRRTDHDFVFEEQSVKYAGGRLRVHVLVAGDKVAEFAHYLHIPEKFERKYADIRSYNELLKQVFQIIFVILSSAVSFVFVWAFASGRIRVKLCVVAAGAAFLLTLLNWFDNLPDTISNYETTMSFNQYMVQSVLAMLLDGFYAVVASVIFVGALEPIYRISFPNHLALENTISFAGLRCSSQLRALLAGLSCFGIHTAYVIGFYLLGQRFGFWSPLEVRETSTLSSLWPAYSAVNIGISAATLEELMYRVLALAMFRRLTGNFWVANLLQAAAWAFMHSDYPQEPAYARGVELSLAGLFYGYILRRFGLVACLLAHYTYDAFLGVTPLFGSGHPLDKVAAALAVSPGVVAAAASAYLIVRRGKNSDESKLDNSAIPEPSKTEVRLADSEICLAYRALSRAGLVLCVAAALFGAGCLFVVKQRTVGFPDRLSVGRERAISIASDILLKEGISVKDPQVVAVLSDETDEDGLQYVYEQSGFARAKQIAAYLEPRLLWKVRFFQPQNPEEFEIELSPDGRFFGQRITQDEDASGGKLSLAAALAKSQDFLKRFHGDLSPLTYAGAVSHYRLARNDFEFEFWLPRLSVAQAKFEVSTAVIGNFVSDFGAYFKLPQSWRFERDKRTIKDEVALFLRIGLSVAVSILALILLVELMRKRHIPFRIAAAIGAMAFVLMSILQLNSLPAWLYVYPSQESLLTFFAKTAIERLLIVFSGAAAVGFLAAVSLSAYRISFPNLPPISLFQAAWPHLGLVTRTTRRLWLDGVVGGLAFSLCFLAMDRLFDFVSSYCSPQLHVLSLGEVQGIGDEWSVALGAVLMAMLWVFMVWLVLPILLALNQRFFKHSVWRLGLFLAIAALILNSSQRYWQDCLLGSLELWLAAALVYFLIVKLARFNVLTYAFAVYFPVLLLRADVLFKHVRFDLCFPQLAVLALAFAAPLVYTGWLYLAPKTELEVVPPPKVA